jgi:nucleoid-associated protein YgaU
LSEALGDPSRPVPSAQERYVVRSGDTLWAIAGRVAPDSDPRPVVDAMVEANDIDPGALVPGQSLVVPSAG